MTEQFSTMPGWVRYDYDKNTDSYKMTRINYPQEETLFLLPHYLSVPKNQKISNYREYVFYNKPQIVWAVGRNNTENRTKHMNIHKKNLKIVR